MRRALDQYKLLDRFLQGPLGHFLKMSLSLHLTAPQLIYHVLLREVTFLGVRHDEMWFEISGTPYRYGMQEFILISGLRFGAIDRESLELKPIEPESLHARLFSQHKKWVTGDDIELLISTREDMVSEDALKLIYITVVDMFLLGQDERGHVDDFLWTMAEDLHAFKTFPWGTYVYSKSQHYIRLARKERKLTSKGGKKINLYGFVWEFKITEMLKQTLDMLRRIDGEMSQASIVRFWEQEYEGNMRVFASSIVSVLEEWTGFIDGHTNGSLPWWTVDYICLKDRRVVIYDSNAMNEENRRSRAESIQPLVSLLPILLKKAAYYEHVTATATLDRDWEVENTDPQKLPQQPDGASCGCYVIKYVEDILRHNEDHWQMHPTVDVRTLWRQIGIFLYRHSTCY
ncbi:uncharacterized protein LOC127802228 [Diospyros lotus]|uniref:uncharacterized protein LOC127802228 n=1 Tax=Diospyros lotus TaxID=55363 RepID=UPI0022582C69|nr:uncharacterized protein LOC127802228 [Diospyros lotus]